MLGRSLAVNDQNSVYDMLIHSDFVNGWDPLQLKDRHDKIGNVNGLGTRQRAKRENSLSSIDWKPLKWTRSISLPSRGSIFCTSNGESTRSLNSNLVDKSPRVMGFSDCVSLATPSSVACCFSPI